MSYNKSRSKGAYAMYVAVEYLTKVYTELGIPQEFLVMPRNRSGDIFTAENFPWCIEVKNRKEWQYKHIINSTGLITSCVRKYWMQVCRDCRMVENRTGLAKEPWLWLTNSREPVFFIFKNQSAHCKRLSKEWLVNHAKFPLIILPQDNLIIFPMVKPSTMAKLICDLKG